MDRNLHSFNGDAAGNITLDGVQIFTADQPGIREYTIHGDVLGTLDHSDALKFSGVRRLNVIVTGDLIGGKEDCVDFNNGCEDVDLGVEGWYHAQGAYLATVKGRCSNIRIGGRIRKHGSVVDGDFDNYSDQSHRRSKGITLNLWTYGEPVTWRSWRGVRPTLENAAAQEYRCKFCLPSWVGLVLNGAMQVGKRLGLAVVILTCVAGCHTASKVRTRLAEAIAPDAAGSPATVQTATAGESLPIPAGSTLIVTKTAPVAAVQPTATAPGVAAQPATERTEIRLAGDSVLTKQAETVAASSGTVDTSLGKAKIDAAERRWLLWAAMVCGVAGMLARSLIPAWPAISNGFLGSAVVAAISWKFAELPAWVWLLVLGGAALLVAGYKRAEWDRNGDGVPDAFQNKKPNAQQ